MKKEGLIFTVVYPQALNFFKDFCASALAQTLMSFDVLVINDGCEETFLKEELCDLDYYIIPAIGSPSKNRQQGINYAIKHGYTFLLLCDSDDTFLPQRYERTITLFNSSGADILACNLNIVDERLRPVITDYFSDELPADSKIEKSFIETKNIFGMSNTALRVESLGDDVSIPETPIADWYLFTVLLNKGLNVFYTKESLVNYRQYASNLIGINCFDVPTFRKLSRLKANHYRLLIEHGYSHYQNYLEDCEALSCIPDFEVEEIIANQLSIHKQPLWWQIVTKDY